MFNEGYSTTDSDQAIRDDVCEEAARLCHLLTEHPHCNTQATHAFLALMLLHASRFDARTDENGEIVLLADQDRGLWDQRMIDRARHYMRAAGEKATSLYHLEASIAYQHCAAKSFDETNWSLIISTYDMLIKRVPSPVYELNRAIAIGKRDGPQTAIKILNQLKTDPMLQRSHLLDATFGELYREQGEFQLAETHFQNALTKTDSVHQQNVIQRRIAECRTS
jgi:RNA polymerase sigma-70 factor (ECF subfamily)